MKLNESIFGTKVILVPYQIKHVPKYHEWMKSEDLLLLTASEPLSLNQEYEMQKSWTNDNDKCTFIVVDKQKLEDTKDELEAMVGDTNIFLKYLDNEVVGEVEIMIAEETARGCGLGYQAVLLMLRYGVENLKIKSYQAKISTDNEPSIRLFSKIGFQQVDESQIFKELTFEQKVSDEWVGWLVQQTNYYQKVATIIT